MRAAEDEFRGKVVLVTGAGRGVGKRLAIGFADAGASLGLLARSGPELRLTQLEIEHSGGEAVTLRADVRRYAQMSAAIERLRNRFGGIDVLLCAAGLQGPIGPFAEVDMKAWAATVETNLFGVSNACRAVLPEMVARRAGKVIVLGGGGTMMARPGFSAYAAAKTAVVRLVETIAEEVREHNIQVNVMGPGHTYTHMTDEVLRAGEAAGWRDSEIARKTQITGGTPPTQQIELAQFLASESSNHISGKLIHIRDPWKKLENADLHAELFTLRRVRKV